MTTFVAVHGAGTGGWLFDDVARRLAAAGHRMLAPSLFGVGEHATGDAAATDVSTHVEQVTELVRSAGATDVVLVGFSYGGYVVTGTAARIPESIARLVYLDAFLPEPGRCLFDQLPPPVRSAMEAAAEIHGEGWRIPPAPVELVGGIGDLEPGVDPDHVDAVLARRGLPPIGTYRDVVGTGFVPARPVPRIFLSCTGKPPGDPLVAAADGLRRAGWTVRDIPTGHFAMLTMPDALTTLLTA